MIFSSSTFRVVLVQVWGLALALVSLLAVQSRHQPHHWWLQQHVPVDRHIGYQDR